MRRKKMAAELEEHARRMVRNDRVNKEQAELVEQVCCLNVMYLCVCAYVHVFVFVFMYSCM